LFLGHDDDDEEEEELDLVQLFLIFFCWVPPSVLFSQAFFSLLSGCGN
jgi:hypothetical protein